MNGIVVKIAVIIHTLKLTSNMKNIIKFFSHSPCIPNLKEEQIQFNLLRSLAEDI